MKVVIAYAVHAVLCGGIALASIILPPFATLLDKLLQWAERYVESDTRPR